MPRKSTKQETPEVSNVTLPVNPEIKPEVPPVSAPAVAPVAAKKPAAKRTPVKKAETKQAEKPPVVISENKEVIKTEQTALPVNVPAETLPVPEVKVEPVAPKVEKQEEVKTEALAAPKIAYPKVTTPLVQTSKPIQPAVAGATPAPVTANPQNNRVAMTPGNSYRAQYNRPPAYQNRPTNQPRVATAPTYAEANAQTEPLSGVLEIANDGQGFVRPKFNPSSRDAYIAAAQIKRMGLRAGDMISGAARLARENEKYGMMTRIDRVNDIELSAMQKRPNFNDLVPIYAQKQAKLESDSQILSTRIIDLFSPIGFGQRGMIVSPPKAGKTTLLKEIAAGVAKNYPEVHLMAVLVGERPEEVTDMQRFVKGEVIASSFDQRPEDQTRAAEIAIERAKRLVEMGKDVFVVFDSITRLARAYNLAIPSSGRTLSGGFDPAALYPSKRFFGAARNIEDGGSLTIIGTALVDTGSKMDELVFEEFKGTGNMELHLTRSLAERRIFPAFNILRSGTRKEEFLLDPAILTKMTAVRRMFDNIEDKEEATIMVMEQMMKTKNNEEFMKKIGKS